MRPPATLAELDAADLRLTPRETALVVRALGLELDVEELAELRRRSEGWPAGVHLMALAMRPPGSRSAAPRAATRGLVDYFRSEVVAGLTEGELAFARRTSVLDRLSGPLCRAVLGGAPAAAAASRRSSTRAPSSCRSTPERRWYRYHPLFGEFLRHELETDEPELVPELYRRAADWYEATRRPGEPPSAPPQAAGDDERVARLVGSLAVPAYCGGELDRRRRLVRPARRGRQLRAPPRDRRRRRLGGGSPRPDGRGRATARVRRAAGARTRWRTGRRLGALVSLVRAALCGDGVERMRADAEALRPTLPAESRLLPSAIGLRGVALLLAGDEAAADDVFAEAGEAAGRLGAPVAHSLALARALPDRRRAR